LERPWPVLQIVILTHLGTPPNGDRPEALALALALAAFDVGVVLQEESKSENHPLQAEYHHAQSTRQLQYHRPILFPHIRLEIPEEIPGPGEDQHRHRPLEDGRQHRGHHVRPVPLPGPRGGRGAARDGPDNGEDVEKDEEDPADGREEAEGEGEEDAAGRGSQQDVVAQQEHLVGVVVGFGHAARRIRSHRQTHLGKSIQNSGNWEFGGLKRRLKRERERERIGSE
ncbi:hypothetical protein TorRG33x02_358240, partial [Trema orientale]